MGGVELGGTKCVLAVAKNPTEIIEQEIISTDRPEVTLPKIFKFFNNFETVGTFLCNVLTSSALCSSG